MGTLCTLEHALNVGLSVLWVALLVVDGSRAGAVGEGGAWL